MKKVLFKIMVLLMMMFGAAGAYAKEKENVLYVGTNAKFSLLSILKMER